MASSRKLKKKEALAVSKIQAFVRGVVVRSQMKDVFAQVQEEKRLTIKVQKLQRKLAKVKTERENEQGKASVLHRGGDSATETDASGTTAGENASPTVTRKAWEESILQRQENVSDESEEEELTSSQQLIMHLQSEYKKLQVRTKTVEGMLKPFQKNLKSLKDDYLIHREKYVKHDGKRKLVEASNKELIRRRKEVEQKSIDFQNEIDGITTKNSKNLSRGPLDFNFMRGMKGIMDIMEKHCPDPLLIEDVREMIQRMNEGALSDSIDGIQFSPHNIGRRGLNKSIGDIGNRSFGDMGNRSQGLYSKSMREFGNTSFGDMNNRSFSGAPKTPGSVKSGKRTLQNSLQYTLSPGNGPLPPTL